MPHKNKSEICEVQSFDDISVTNNAIVVKRHTYHHDVLFYIILEFNITCLVILEVIIFYF